MAVKTKSCCFPHAGGDVSVGDRVAKLYIMFSPRRWGCFRGHDVQPQAHQVFPTQVGMFPRTCSFPCGSVCFPHAGGDVSAEEASDGRRLQFSPRRWGCFSSGRSSRRRSPCFPHAGGDVSIIFRKSFSLWMFSPRRWGCFLQRQRRLRAFEVFPTQVGMFPRRWPCFRPTRSFPHAGGDVSGKRTPNENGVWFSPRRWGCFYRVLDW